MEAESESVRFGEILGKSDLLGSPLALFMTLDTLGMLWPSLASLFALVVSVIQPIAFVVNTRWGWGWFMSKLSEGVYVSLIPFWDPVYVHSWQTVGAVTSFWLVTLLIVCEAAMLGTVFNGGADHTPRKLLVVLRMMVHSTATVLFTPIVCFLLTSLVCDKAGEKLWLVPDEECGSPVHIVQSVLGITTLALVTLIALTVRCLLYFQSPLSLQRWSRAHPYCDAVGMVYDLATPVLYFCLLSQSYERLFATLHCINSLAMGVMYAFVQPYYSQDVNLIRAMGYFTASGLSAFVIEHQWELVARGYDTPVVVGICVLSWLLAVFCVRRARVPPVYSHVMSLVYEGENPTGHTPLERFPLGLPRKDLQFTRSPAQVEALLQPERSIANDTPSHLARGALFFNVSYLHKIYLPTDIEVACRFLRDYTLRVGSMPARQDIGYYLRIITKGLCKFPRSGVVRFQYITFLHYYCRHHMLALEELSDFLTCPQLDLSLLYSAFKLGGRLKAILNIKETVLHKTLLKAQRIHIQVLGYMTMFWMKLMAESFDKEDLAVLVDTISEKRDEGLAAFEISLRSGFTASMGMRYARFLEQVMLDESGAANIRAALKDIQGDTKQDTSKASERVMTQLDTVKASVKRSSRTTSTLDIKMNIVFILFFFIVVGFGVVEVVTSAEKRNFIHKIHVAGKARSLSEFASFVSLVLVKTAAKEKMRDSNCHRAVCSATGLLVTDYDCSVSQIFPETIKLRDRLKQTASEFRTEFNKLSSGVYSSSQADSVHYMKDKIQQVESFEGAPEGEVKWLSMWDVCTTLMTSLEALLEIEPPCLEYGISQSFIFTNAERSFAPMINATMEIYEDEFTSLLYISVSLHTGLFIIALCLLYCACMMLDFSFLEMENTKMETLNLFALIPKSTVHSIYLEAKDRQGQDESNAPKTEDTDASSSEPSQGSECEGDKKSVSGAFKMFLRDTSKSEGKVIKHNLAEQNQDPNSGATTEEVEELSAIEGGQDEKTPLVYVPDESRPQRLRAMLMGSSLLVSFCLLGMLIFGLMLATTWIEAVEKIQSVQGMQHSLASLTFDGIVYAQKYQDTCKTEYFGSYGKVLYTLEDSDPLGGLQREYGHEVAHMQELHQIIMNEQSERMTAARLACAKGEQHASAVLLRSHEITQFVEELLALDRHAPSDEIHTLLTVIIVFSVLLAVLSTAKSFAGDPSTPIVHTYGLRLVSLLCLGVLVMCIGARQDHENLDDAFLSNDMRISLEQTRFHFIVLFDSLHNWLIVGETSWLAKYFSIIGEKVSLLAPLDHTYQGLSENFGKKLEFNSVYESLAMVEYLNDIVIVLNLNLTRELYLEYETRDDLDIPHLFKDFRWDSATDYSQGYHPPYSNYNTDMKLNATERLDLSWKILKSGYYLHQRDRLWEDFAALSEILSGDTTLEVAETKYDWGSTFIAAILLQSVISLILLVVTVSTVVRGFKEAIVANGSKGNKSPVLIFGKHMFRVKVSLLLVAVFVVSVFVLQVVTVIDLATLPALLNKASVRSWYSAKCALSGERFLHVDHGDDLQHEVTKHAIIKSSELLRRGVDTFYFSVPGSTASTMFDPSTKTDHRMQCASPYTAVSDYGDVETRKYLHLLFAAENKAFTTEKEEALAVRTNVDSILASLAESTLQLKDKRLKDVDSTEFVVLVLLVVTVLTLTVEAIFVFRPMTSKLLQQQEGTKLMLKMIPEKERQTVGAIVQYLETGQISNNKKLSEVNQVVTKISTVPTIVIDPYGKILLFSRASVEVFGYEERDALNKNVKMLMTEEHEPYHDMYLARYRKTGIKRIIGSSRNSKATRKDGSVFPINVSVHEFRQGKKSVYIGFVSDISLDIETEHVHQLSNATSRASTIPVVCIDLRGVIVRWNHAAAEAFGYSAKETLNHNVKMLMKPEVAECHDQYLEKFKRTPCGKSKLVGTGTKITQVAVRKNGTQFSVEFFLEEVRLGQDTVLIANLRDVTDEFKIQQIISVHETIIQTTPIPLIVANTLGIIQKISPAAERELGWKMADLVGQNITAIQEDEIAARHDQILATYMKTGKKNIIGSTRKVKVKRKNGVVYTAAIHVRDVVSKEDNVKFPPVFIGYLVNQTEENRKDDLRNIALATIALCQHPVIVSNNEGVIEIFSKSASEVTGYASEEAVGRNVTLIQPLEAAEKHPGYIEHYLQTGEPRVLGKTIEVPVKRRNDTIITCTIEVQELRTKYGHKFIAQMVDISTALEAEKINKIVSVVIALCPVALICINASGQIRIFSEAACKLFGWEQEDIMYKNVKVLMQEEVAEQHDEVLLRYKNTRKQKILNTTQHLPAQRKDNSQFTAELQVSEFMQDSESFFVGFITDFTSHKAFLIESMIAKSVMQGSRSGIISINRVGIIGLMSQAAREIFGCKEGELEGQNIKILMPSQIADHHDGYLKKYMKTGIKTVVGDDFVTVAKKLSGKEFSITLSIRETLLTSLSGAKYEAFVGYLTDNSSQCMIQENTILNEASEGLAYFPIVVITITGKIVSFNKHACNTFGFKEEEAVGSNVKMILPPEIAEHHDGYLARYKKTKVKHIIDSSRKVTGMKKDGTLFPIEVFVREVVQDGKATYYGNIHDISEQLAIEFAKEVMDTVLMQSNQPIISIDEWGKVLCYNRRAQAVFEYNEREVMGKNIKMLQPQAVADAHDEYLAAYKRTGIAKVVNTVRTVTGKRKNGRPVGVTLNVKELFCEEKRVYVGFLIDDEEERAAKQQELAGKALLKGMLTPCLRITHLGEIVQASDSVAICFGYSEEELLTMNVKELQHPEIAEKHDGYLARYLKTGVQHVLKQESRTTGRRRDGTIFHCLISVKEIATKNAKEPFFVGFVKDLTNELKSAQQHNILKKIQDISVGSLFEMDEAGILRGMNASAEALFGYTKAELVGKKVNTIQPDEIAEVHDRYLEEYKKNKVRHIIGKEQLLKGKAKSGKLLNVFVDVREITVNGFPSTYVSFIRDADVALEAAKMDKVIEVSIASFPFPCVICSTTGDIESCSNSFKTVFECESPISMNIKEFMPVETALNHDGYLQAYRNTGKQTVMNKFTKLSGLSFTSKVIPIESWITEVKVETEHKLIGYLRDMTPELLQKKHGLFTEHVAQCAPVGMLCINSVGEVLKENIAALKLIGRSVVGTNVREIMPEPYRSEHSGYLQHYMDTKEKRVIGKTTLVSLLNEQGKQIRVSLMVSEIDLNISDPVFLGSLTDLSDSDYMDYLEKFNAGVESLVNEAVLCIDLSGRVLRFNVRAEEIFGYRSDEVLGNNIKMLLSKDIADKHDGYLERFNQSRASATGLLDTYREGVAVTKDGKEFNAVVRVVETQLEGTKDVCVLLGFVMPTT